MVSSSPIPDLFCWTRYGMEAGESVDQILSRKELERQGNNGLFLWGIGNAIGPAIRELVKRCQSPEVLFSPIKSRPRPADASSENVVAWTNAEAVDGNPYQL